MAGSLTEAEQIGVLDVRDALFEALDGKAELKETTLRTDRATWGNEVQVLYRVPGDDEATLAVKSFEPGEDLAAGVKAWGEEIAAGIQGD